MQKTKEIENIPSLVLVGAGERLPALLHPLGNTRVVRMPITTSCNLNVSIPINWWSSYPDWTIYWPFGFNLKNGPANALLYLWAVDNATWKTNNDARSWFELDKSLWFSNFEESLTGCNIFSYSSNTNLKFVISVWSYIIYSPQFKNDTNSRIKTRFHSFRIFCMTIMIIKQTIRNI